MKNIFVFVLFLLLVGCGKTCEELGGDKVRDGGHVQIISHGNGIMTPIYIPDYKCIRKDESKTNDKEIVYRVIQEEEMQPAYRNEPGQRWWQGKGNVK